MYKEFKGLDLPTIDKEILAFWDANDIFHKSVQQRPEDNRFVFYEGPPSANGMPGIHHVMARAVKDLFCRFQSMQGKRVERKGGWDTHGLPIELNVEKELGITKEDIGSKITVDEYNQKCRETVMRFKDRWDDITRKMGYWVDLDNPYITFENSYIESVWWLLNELYRKGLLYKGYTIQPYSPAAGTGLSSHELNLPGCYREVSDQSVVAQFKVKRNDHSAFLFDEVKEGEVYFLAWTTTPWTLPSNTALAVGGGIDYVRVFTYNPYTKLPVNLILAKDLLKAWFKPEAAEASFEEWTPEQKLIPYRVTAEYRGATLEGVDYEQLMPYVQPEDGDAFKVLVGDFVSTEDGTGIVHIAPSFGADDMRVAKKYGIGALTLVDRQGKFVDEVTDYAGRYVKDYKNEGKDFVNVDIDIVVQLKKENKAFATEKYVHNYPHCWRTDKPVLYYPLDSWFIRASAFKERMYELNQTINWKPASTGEGRFGKWLENLQDWNLSRSRFWGIPLPIWRTKDGVYENCIDSVEELRKEIEKANKVLGMSQTVPKDLHRPYIDEIVLVAENGEPMYREPDLIDVWFDSGAMPYAQWHYPFENKEKFGHSFPADFIAEGVDQTRGWFYTLHAIATMVFDSMAFKTVVSNGLVLDANGDKMSKSKGNVVDPFVTIEKYSADCTRWYMISNAPPWDNLRFDTKGIEEVRRKFFGTLYNTYSFFALYANIDKFEYREADLPLEKRHESDRWIISELNSLVKNVTADFADYEPTSAVRRIEHFVDAHLSNWYVRLNRRRFWKGDYTDDKIAAYQTLYTCLVTISKLMAPVAPFFADWLYRNLNEATKKEAHESVHLTDFPKADEKAIDKALEQRMEYAQDICSLVLSLRKRENIRVRQPLHKILLPVLDPAFKPQVEAVRELILAEVNIKDIEYLEDTAGFLKKKIKPNYKTLGKRLGKDMKAAADLIAAMNQETINAIEKTGKYDLHINGTSYELTAEDFEIAAEDIPGWLVASDGVLTVALDITLTPELLAEGMARELVNRIQNIRKNSDFNVTDRIEVVMTRHAEVEAAVGQFGEYIKNETLANAITFSDSVEGEETELTEGVVVRIGVRKVSMNKLEHIGVKGSGFFCIVKKYKDKATGNEFALKELKKAHYQNEEYRYRFNREIYLLKELQDCDNIIELLDFGHNAEKEKLWYLMPYADQNLYEFIKENNPTLSKEERYDFVTQIINAIKFAHDKKILHRDLSSNNVLVFQEDGKVRLKVSDFGLGKDEKSLSFYTASSTSGYGQILYVSPEQRLKLKDATEKSDIYSLGKLVYFIFTGKDPDSIKPFELFSLVSKSVEETPEDRFGNIYEFEKHFLFLKDLNLNKKIDLQYVPLSEFIESKSEIDWTELHEVLVKGTYFDHVYHEYILPVNKLFSKKGNLESYYSNVGNSINHFVKTYSSRLNECYRTVRWPFSEMDTFGKILIKILKTVSDEETKLLCLKQLWYLAFEADQWSVQRELKTVFNSNYISEGIETQLAEYIIQSHTKVDMAHFSGLNLPSIIKSSIIKGNNLAEEAEKERKEKQNLSDEMFDW